MCVSMPVAWHKVSKKVRKSKCGGVGQSKYAVVLIPGTSGDGDGMCSDPSSIKNIVMAGMETASQHKLYIYIYVYTYHSVAGGHRHREEAFIYLQRIHLVTNDSSTIRPTRWRSFYRVHWEHLDLEWCDHFVNNPPSFLALTLIHLQHWNLKTWPRGISYLESWCNKKNMNFQTNLIFWNHLVQE